MLDLACQNFTVDLRRFVPYRHAIWAAQARKCTSFLSRRYIAELTLVYSRSARYHVGIQILASGAVGRG